jgi:SAM-dependent methyltransferase
MSLSFDGRVIDGITCYAPEIADSYDSYPSHGFDVTVEVEEASFWCRSRNRLVTSLMDRYAPRDRRVRMLEIGCGTGTVLSALRRLPNVDLTGSEIYLSGLRHARRRLPEIEFIQLDATHMPFEREFDVVGAFDVLEHIKDDEQVMRNVHHALQDGGVFLATVPQYAWMWSELDELVHHQRRYSRRELVEKLQRTGFDLEYVGSFVSSLFPLMAAKRLMSRRSARADPRAAFAEHVQLPGVMNAVFDKVMRIDEGLVRMRVPLPFGGSLVAVARKR